ncbi:MAG: hypothetical protein LBK70_03300 [Clostridiales bacterium]|jgi:hypothetical protein|nr:hypothetical protein [Clostridiales bacterium]
MLYKLLFSPSFNKDFSHLIGPPVDSNWDKFKKGAYGYIIQTHNSGSGEKNFMFVSNTSSYLAFGIYASIHDMAVLGKVDPKYKLRRRGGDHSAKVDGEGDYPTEAAVGLYWNKTEGNILESNQYIDVSIASLIKIFEDEIVPYWDRPRSAISAREHIVKQAELTPSDTPTIPCGNCEKDISNIINGKANLLKVNEEKEEAIFYHLIHAVLHNKINRDFNFCTDFNSKLFKGQNVIDIGTTRDSGLLGGLFGKKKKPISAPIMSHGTGDFVDDTQVNYATDQDVDMQESPNT